jgi:uncharacterized alpha-E superfamily protein
MLSRVAESLYWMSRYVERAENVARFISVNLNLILDLPGSSREQWLPLVLTTGDYDKFQERYTDATRQNVLHFLTGDHENFNSIISCLYAARENARSIREIISSEMWEHINRFYLMVQETHGKSQSLEHLVDFYEQIRYTGQHFVGVTDATMTHGDGWHLSRMAHLIERADKTSRILDVKYLMLLPSPEDVGTTYDDLHWTSLLRSASAFEMYRQRHGQIRPDRVVNFLILDRQFPRAVLYCLTKANESLHAISGAALGGFCNPAEQQLGHLHASLAYTRAPDIIAGGLHEFVDDLQSRLNNLSDAIYETFFAMRPIEAHSYSNGNGKQHQVQSISSSLQRQSQG